MRKAYKIFITGMLIAVFLFSGCQKKTGTQFADENTAVEETAVSVEEDQGSGDTDNQAGEKNRYYTDEQQLVLVTRVTDLETWEEIADRLYENEFRGTRYLIPVENNTAIPAFFLNIHYTEKHDVVLKQFFPEQYPNLTYNEYVTKAIDPAKREFYTGNITERIDEEGNTFFTFTIWHNVFKEKAAITEPEAHWVYERLKQLFSLGSLAFDPFSRLQRQLIVSWNPSFAVYHLNELENGFEAYNQAVAFGRLRLYSLKEFGEAAQNGDFGFQDIIAIDESPLDVEKIVAGIITGTRQGELSHMSVRSAARNTPNCYIRDPLNALKSWEGELVRLEVGKKEWKITRAGNSEAENWWKDFKPAPISLEAPDYENSRLENLLDIPAATAGDRTEAVLCYGAKAANLAILYREIEPAYRLKGFAIPFYWYRLFMENNSWSVSLDGIEKEYTFNQTLQAWLSDVTFRSDAGIRKEKLKALRKEMQKRSLPEKLFGSIIAKIKETGWNQQTMLRFRSSSNAEDSLYFSGAGLYDSRSGCYKDDLDQDTAGPCLCDSNEKNEKSVREAITTVWASLWHFQAFEERDWYGIDHNKAAMAILVNDRSKKEKANIVAFTGNPGSRDDRFLINAQQDELPVVSGGPGIFPEKSLIAVEEGIVKKITRVCYSSEAVTDIYILKEENLKELSELLWRIRETFPLDKNFPTNSTLLWDTEWKILENGRLIIKQIRPFLKEKSFL